MTGELIAEIRQVRRLLVEASRQLETPNAESVSACAERLDEAIDRIVDFEVHARRAPESDRPLLREEMYCLRQELHVVGRLLAQAAQLQIGWAQMLGAIPASYDEQGSMQEHAHSSLEVKG